MARRLKAMRRLTLSLIATLTVLAAAPGSAEEAKGASTKATGQYVDLAAVALPIVLDNRIINYVFVSVRVNLSAGANAPKLQSKEPYFRDALVRAGHRTPFTRLDNFTVVDDAKLKASMYAAAVAIAGQNNVASVTILSETPKQRGGFPKPKSAPAH